MIDGGGGSATEGARRSVPDPKVGRFQVSLRGSAEAAPFGSIPERLSHDRWLSDSGAKDIQDRSQASVPESSANRF